ncbi:MAG: hypothetical protein B7733_13875 [Myxococcales bacterium FL481]|nr:MAG: hypothetical protein B7733_13875 [Myxococcales bacterium FL481]
MGARSIIADRVVAFASRSRFSAAVVVLVAAVLSVATARFGSSIALNTDLKALLPSDAPSVAALREAAARRGPTDLLTVAIECDDPVTRQGFAQDLADVITTWPEVEELRFERDYTVLRNHALYYLDSDELLGLRDELRHRRRRAVGGAIALGISGEAVPVEAMLVGDDWDTELEADLDDDDDAIPAAPAGGGIQAGPADGGAPPAANDAPSVADAKPEDLRSWLAQRRRSFVADGRLSEAEIDLVWPREDDAGELVFPDRVARYRTSPDGRIQVIQAQLSRPATDLAFSQELSARVQAAIADLEPSQRDPSLRAMLVGSYEVSNEVNAVLVDLQRATWLSAVLVLLVLSVAFRSGRVVFVVLLPLAVAMCVTLAAARLIYGELNSLTAFLFAVLFGMGVDFAVHLVAQRERRPHETWSEIVTTQLRPLTAAMATTVASLWVLTLAHFKAFREFGVISGIGVLVCLLAAVVLVPALDTLLSAKRPWAATRRDSPGLAWSGIGGAHIAARLVVVGLLAGAAFGLHHVTFEHNLRALTAPKPPTAKRRIGYGSALGSKRTSVPVVLLAEREEELETAIERFREVAATPTGRVDNSGKPVPPWVKDALSPATLLPADQAAKVPILKEIAGLGETFLAELPDLPPDDPARGYRTHLQALVRLAAAQPIGVADLPGWATRPFAERDGALGRLGVLYLKFKQHDLREVRWVVDEVRGRVADLDIAVASSSFVYADLGAALEDDASRLPPLALGIILLALALDLRRIAPTLRCFAALALGLGSTLGLMGLGELHINFYNLVVMPAVIGLGIDASIHLWHARQARNVGATGKATAVAGATTIAAFCGLLAVEHPGLRSIAEVAILAIVCSLAAAFAVLVDWRGLARAAVQGSIRSGGRGDRRR